jgi:hypothetical protein
VSRGRGLRAVLVAGMLAPVCALAGAPAGASGSAGSEVGGIDIGRWLRSAPLAFAGAAPIHFTIGVDTSSGGKAPKLLSFTAKARCTVVPGSSPNQPYPKPRILTFTWKDSKAFDNAHGPVGLSTKSSGGETDQTDGNVMDEELSFPSPGAAKGWFTASYDYPGGAWTCSTGKALNEDPQNLHVTFTAHRVS